MKHYYSKITSLCICLLIVVVSFQSCVKEKIDVTKSGNNSINPQYAGALVYSSLTLADIMKKTSKNGQLVADSTGFLTLVYKGNLFSLPAAQVATIPVQSPVSGNYSLSNADATAINALPNGSTFTIKDSSLVNFQAGGTTQINTLSCKTATLNININYGIAHTATIVVSIPAATLGGVPFSKSIPIAYSGSSPVIVNQNYDLSNYSIDMTNHGTTHNTINVYYTITITKDANPTNVGDAVSFTETFTNVTYNNMVGYLGQQALSPNTDTIPITLFNNNLLTGNITLVNPQIKVFLTNSYGLPIQANFTTFEGYTAGHPAYNITGAPNPIPIPIPAAIGQSAEDSFKLNNGNSNIVSLMNNFPKNVIYHINSMSNPLGPVYTNFITDTSQFRVDMEVDLPLWGTVTNFTFQDTLAYKFNLSTNYVEAITVRAYISNGFPLDVDMSINFVDSAYHVIDSLITHANQLVMPSASINGAGMVTTPTQHSVDFIIPSSVMPQINNIKHILIGARVNSAGNSNTPATAVKIYDYYHLDVKIGVNIQMLLKF